MRKACLALLLAASVSPALAQDKTVDLKVSHWVPASHPLQKSLEDWVAAVNKDSGGTITGKVFPAQQLGKAFDHYDMARDGIADVTYVNPGYQPGRFPIIGAGELPFLISDAKGGSMGLDAWYRKYAEKEMKDVKYCLAFVHSPSSFHSKTKKIVTPEDVKGLKIRPAHASMSYLVTLSMPNSTREPQGKVTPSATPRSMMSRTSGADDCTLVPPSEVTKFAMVACAGRIFRPFTSSGVTIFLVLEWKEEGEWTKARQYLTSFISFLSLIHI